VAAARADVVCAAAGSSRVPPGSLPGVSAEEHPPGTMEQTFKRRARNAGNIGGPW